MRTGRLLGSGRTADVYELDESTWVLRRYRDGFGDAVAEAAVMEHVRSHGYPVPEVRAATSTDLVLERLSGPTMLEAFGAGLLDARESGEMLATLLHGLHAVPPRDQAASGTRVLHLDLHPENVMLTPDGPRVIDWANSEEGAPGLDRAMSAVILAQVAVSADPLAAPARAMLTALLAAPSAVPEAGRTAEGLPEACGRRAANPTMSRSEVELLGAAEQLIRTLLP
ncbi:phosphotransferase [Streptomyces turgidiscabies]|uniref:Phosphotransferase enzyme family protein n=1 Tax=Streptomyces turgidiscabies (strain Car8) TaxID=698760 RepID=L7EZI2_STRT8|nr:MULTISPECIES: phosphotransferase [Streptomyces]ELP64848.1 phosphotransferase enzyme family protein [Streptomyces turgidiscabies Car8]MDX3494293.1 phosphotransferase [Streptomyces turgidiscabies]GAQ68333.1 phosphotransferase enzyme family protein [Streptomyces turgidiscabies]